MAARTKAIAAIEEKLAAIDPESERGRVLAAARQFKSNWIELGQLLSGVLQKHKFEGWGFTTFDRYVTAELRLKKDTAMKLVRGFSFVKEERPEMLREGRQTELPPLEVLDFLSQRREDVPREQFDSLAAGAFTEAWSPRTVSQKWRDLVGDERSAPADNDDPSFKAVRRARELAERLQTTLVEIPGVDQEALDAVTSILQSLQSLQSLGANG